MPHDGINNFKTHITGLDKDFQNSGGKAYEFMKLLTQDQSEQE